MKEDLIAKYASLAQNIYEDRSAGDYTWSGLLTEFLREVCPLPPGTTHSWCVCCEEVTPVEWFQVDAPGVPECRYCGATDLTPTNR